MTSREVRSTYPFKGADREKEVVATAAGTSLRLRFVFVGNNADPLEHPLRGDADHGAFWGLANRSADVLVTNLATLHATDVEGDWHRRRSAIAGAVRALAGRGPRVVLFGPPAKHVNELGYHRCGTDGLSLDWLRNWGGAQVEGLIRSKGTAMEWEASRAGLGFLDAHAISRDRLDAHVSGADCTHYCQPGLPELWADALVALLCGEDWIPPGALPGA